MQEKYDIIGTDYNLTRKADKYLTKRILENLVPVKGGTYLDIGCGTGNYTSEFHQLGFDFIGIDPSDQMLKSARLKNEEMDWRAGHAENTSLHNESVDGIVASLTMHHWQNVKQSFREMYRILKGNGNMVIFTSTPKQMKGYWLNHYFPKMMAASAMQMPSLKLVKEAMKEAGLVLTKTESYSIKPDLQDLFLFSGKHLPELYLNPDVLQGISSFSNLANADEVKKGLKKLAKDIKTRKIDTVIKKYENDLGDYLFIKCKKMKRFTKKCPTCQSNDQVVPIMYGMPGPKMQDDHFAGKIHLGGCVISENDPKWFCQRDEVEF